MEKMANHAAELIEKTPFPDRAVEQKGPRGRVAPASLRDTQKRQADFFRNFAKQVGILKEIATKELAQKEMTAQEKRFLEDVVQIRRGSGFTSYNGWYPGLFYKGRPDAGKWDAIVADVHTDVPAPVLGDPGCVLHQGIGNVDLLLIAIDNGKDRMVFAGPLLSHYEFEMTGVSRKADSEWRREITQGRWPQRPEWTRAYLVPGANPNAPRYGQLSD
jgi:hypothetical protein